jgi:hypothetical protein
MVVGMMSILHRQAITGDEGNEDHEDELDGSDEAIDGPEWCLAWGDANLSADPPRHPAMSLNAILAAGHVRKGVA